MFSFCFRLCVQSARSLKLFFDEVVIDLMCRGFVSVVIAVMLVV